jgi:hypothetical protein
LFGTDHSSSAHWAYVWGVKGRYDEPKNDQPPDLDDLNDYNRNLYRNEVAGLIERFNGSLKPGSRSFTRRTSSSIAPSGVGLGRSSTRRQASQSTTAPTKNIEKTTCRRPEDKKLLLEIIANEKKWIAEKRRGARSAGVIGEVRKSAINL